MGEETTGTDGGSLQTVRTIGVAALSIIGKCSWCGKEKKEGDKWVTWCCKGHCYLGNRELKKQKEKEEERLRPKPKRHCLMCGKKDIEEWFCPICKPIKNSLSSIYADEALGIASFGFSIVEMNREWGSGNKL